MVRGVAFVACVGDDVADVLVEAREQIYAHTHVGTICYRHENLSGPRLEVVFDREDLAL